MYLLCSLELEVQVRKLRDELHRMTATHEVLMHNFRLKEHHMVLTLCQSSHSLVDTTDKLIKHVGVDNIPPELLMVARKFCPTLGLTSR